MVMVDTHGVSDTSGKQRETYISDSAESPDGRASVHIFLSCHVLGQTKKNQVRDHLKSSLLWSLRLANSLCPHNYLNSAPDSTNIY